MQWKLSCKEYSATRQMRGKSSLGRNYTNPNIRQLPWSYESQGKNQDFFPHKVKQKRACIIILAYYLEAMSAMDLKVFLFNIN